MPSLTRQRTGRTGYAFGYIDGGVTPCPDILHNVSSISLFVLIIKFIYFSTTLFTPSLHTQVRVRAVSRMYGEGPWSMETRIDAFDVERESREEEEARKLYEMLERRIEARTRLEALLSQVREGSSSISYISNPPCYIEQTIHFLLYRLSPPPHSISSHTCSINILLI